MNRRMDCALATVTRILSCAGVAVRAQPLSDLQNDARRAPLWRARRVEHVRALFEEFPPFVDHSVWVSSSSASCMHVIGIPQTPPGASPSAKKTTATNATARAQCRAGP